MHKTLLVSFALLFAACGGNNSNAKTGDQAKKAAPKDPKKLTSKPATATMMGTSTKVKAPGNTNAPSLGVPGGNEAQIFAWQADLTDSGYLSDCAGAFLENGSAVLACSPLIDTCDDGSEVDTAFLLAYDANQGLGAFALAGSDLCGQGYDVVACNFDNSGNVGNCGVGNIVDDHIEVSE